MLHWVAYCLDLPGASELSLIVTGGGPVQVCASCELDDECVSVPDAGVLPVGPEVVLHFAAGSPESHLSELLLLAH